MNPDLVCASLCLYSKPLCRKLIVTEGIFANVGDIAPLDKMYAIKERYKYRLVVS